MPFFRLYRLDFEMPCGLALVRGGMVGTFERAIVISVVRVAPE